VFDLQAYYRNEAKRFGGEEKSGEGAANFCWFIFLGKKKKEINVGAEREEKKKNQTAPL